MVNKTIVNYLNQNRPEYSIDSLKQALLKKGYPKKDVEEAIDHVTKDSPAPKPPKFSPTPPPYTPPAPKYEGNQESMSHSLVGLSYLIWVIAIVVAVTAKKSDKFARYHGFQALFYGLIYGWIFGFVLGIFIVVSGILTIIPIIGIIIFLFALIVMIAVCGGITVFSIIFTVKASQGKMFKIPLATNIMKSMIKDL